MAKYEPLIDLVECCQPVGSEAADKNAVVKKLSVASFLLVSSKSLLIDVFTMNTPSRVCARCARIVSPPLRKGPTC